MTAVPELELGLALRRPRLAAPLRADIQEKAPRPLPETPGGWATVLADPPWRFTNRTGKVAPEHRRLDRYDTMTGKDICALPLAGVAAECSHLYLWVPNALLPEGLQVMEAWGFRYVSNLVWAKRRKEGGRTVGNQHPTNGRLLSMAQTPRLRRRQRLTGTQGEALGAELLKRYQAGRSIRDICRETGYSIGRVRRLLVGAGVEFRGRGGANRRRSG